MSGWCLGGVKNNFILFLSCIPLKEAYMRYRNTPSSTENGISLNAMAANGVSTRERERVSE